MHDAGNIMNKVKYVYLYPYNTANINVVKNTMVFTDKNLSVLLKFFHFSFNFDSELSLKYIINELNILLNFVPNIHKKENVHGKNPSKNNPITLILFFMFIYSIKLYDLYTASINDIPLFFIII